MKNYHLSFARNRHWMHFWARPSKFFSMRFLIDTNTEIKIEREELLTYAKQLVRNQFVKYGIYNMEEEKLNTYSEQMIKDEKEVKKLSNELIENKIFHLLKSSYTLNKKQLTYEEFTNLAQGKTLEHSH